MVMVNTTEVDAAGFDPVSLDETLATVRKFWMDFPDAASALARVFVGDFSVYSPDPQTWPDAETFLEDGVTSPGGRPIVTGDRYSVRLSSWEFGPGNRPNLLRVCALDEANHFHPCNAPRATLEHELGHVLDLYASQSPEGADFPLSFQRITNPFEALSVSPYGLQAGPHEVFADAFAGWWDESRVRPISANIREAIRDAAYVGGWQS